MQHNNEIVVSLSLGPPLVVVAVVVVVVVWQSLTCSALAIVLAGAWLVLTWLGSAYSRSVSPSCPPPLAGCIEREKAKERAQLGLTCCFWQDTDGRTDRQTNAYTYIDRRTNGQPDLQESLDGQTNRQTGGHT